MSEKTPKRAGTSLDARSYDKGNNLKQRLQNLKMKTKNMSLTPVHTT